MGTKYALAAPAVGIIRKIQKRMLDNPTSFDIGILVQKLDKKREAITGTIYLTGELIPPCGTTACVAGWTLIESGKRWKVDHAMAKAGKILGIEPREPYAWMGPDSVYAHVFVSRYWPQPFRRRDMGLLDRLLLLERQMGGVEPTKEQARAILSVIKKRNKVASERLDYLLETGE